MKKKNQSNHPKQSPNVVTGSFNGDLILFHQLSKQYYMLNGVAARIWQFCNGSNPVSEIVGLIGKDFDSPPEQIAADVTQTVEGFNELGLVET